MVRFLGIAAFCGMVNLACGIMALLQGWSYGNCYPFRREKGTAFLLTADVKKWMIVSYIPKVLFVVLCDCLLGKVRAIGEYHRTILIYCALLDSILVAGWFNRAIHTVIRLSKEKPVSEADLEQHIKAKLRAARRAYPEPVYLCRIEETRTRKGFWTYETWSVCVEEQEEGQVILNEPIAKRDRYRYFDGEVIRLLHRFEKVTAEKSSPAQRKER